jgi:hypothetical protein
MKVLIYTAGACLALVAAFFAGRTFDANNLRIENIRFVYEKNGYHESGPYLIKASDVDAYVASARRGAVSEGIHYVLECTPALEQGTDESIPPFWTVPAEATPYYAEHCTQHSIS